MEALFIQLVIGFGAVAFVIGVLLAIIVAASFIRSWEQDLWGGDE